MEDETAWTRLVLRGVLHWSLRGRRQVLHVAMAGSTSARIFACERFTSCCPPDRFSRRPRNGTRTAGPAPW